MKQTTSTSRSDSSASASNPVLRAWLGPWLGSATRWKWDGSRAGKGGGSGLPSTTMTNSGAGDSEARLARHTASRWGRR